MVQKIAFWCGQRNNRMRMEEILAGFDQDSNLSTAARSYFALGVKYAVEQQSAE